jgi:hypothetical protein
MIERGEMDVPRAAWIADALTLAFALIALLLAITGRVRMIVSGTGVSIASAHAAFAALAVTAVRHAAVPRPSALFTIRLWRGGIQARPAVADAMVAFWTTRPAVLLIGLLAVATVGIAPDAPDAGLHRDVIRALPARWDSQWYAGIALHGYEWQYRFDRQQNLAFFPAYPAAIRAVGYLVGAFRSGVPPERQIALLTWCGVAIALVAFFWAAWLLSRLAREAFGETRGSSAVLLLAAYPFALFFSAAYTESLYLLAALATWQSFRRRAVGATIGWGVLAGLVRPNGFFLTIPLSLIAMGVRDAGAPLSSAPRRASFKWLCLSAAPVAGMLLYTAYLYRLTGIWFAWSRLQVAWGRVFGAGAPLGLSDALSSGGLLDVIAAHPYDAINAGGLIFVVVMAAAVWRMSPAWAAFVFVNVLAPLAAGGLLSMGRLTSTLFPLFLALANRASPRTVAALVTSFAVMQGLLAALFFTWRAVY